MSEWFTCTRADQRARVLADRHYNRQNANSKQFVPPGRCVVLLSDCHRAVWVTSWPFARFVKHQWAGAWINSLFRNESGLRASDLILRAVAVTRFLWPDIPALGLITFVDPKFVRPTVQRGQAIYGYSYQRAGFAHVGFTKGGLWAWQLLPQQMPVPHCPSPLDV